MAHLAERFKNIRKHTENICAPLSTEDYVAQPIVDVSPPKWHLGHSTWFFETFVLSAHKPGYRIFNDDFSFIFNSYYEAVGKRVVRAERGNLTRPTVGEVYRYRAYIDDQMAELLESKGDDKTIEELVELGLQHEQQHQELLITDIKYILGHNPLLPMYDANFNEGNPSAEKTEYISIDEGIYDIGYSGTGFCYDNELSRHKVYLQPFQISSALVSNKEYLDFIADGGYGRFEFWHSEGWDWVQKNDIKSPLYWHKVDDAWYRYGLRGFHPLKAQEPLCHVSYYEAAAFAEWAGKRLPTEYEWEIASQQFQWGDRWELTNSAYLPYPGFEKADGAIGEYNGKFMVNQMVLRGASVATSEGHSRHTYRNFFHPNLRWQFTGIRLAQ
jgi:ergothioneine biosynthesis protein EgtB